MCMLYTYIYTYICTILTYVLLNEFKSSWINGRFVDPGSTIPPSAFTLINDDAAISC